MAKKKRLNKNLVVAITFVGFVIMTGTGIALVMQLKSSDPTSLEQKGMAYLEEDSPDYVNALQYFSRAFKVSSQPKYLILIGDMYRELGEDRKAENVWMKAAEMDPDSTQAWDRLLKTRIDTVELYFSNRLLSPAVCRNLLDFAVEVLNPNQSKDENSEDRTARGLYAMGTALTELWKIQASEGEKEDNAGTQESGLETMREMLRFASRKLDQDTMLAILGAAIGETDYDGRIKIKKTLAEAKPDVLKMLGIEALEEACRLKPLDVDYVNRRAKFLAFASNGKKELAVEKAEALYKDQVERFGDQQGEESSRARLNYARFLLDQNRMEDALGWYQQAIQVAENDQEAKGKALTQLGEYWKTRWILSKIKAGKNGEGDTRFRENAIASFNKAIEAAPALFDPYLSLMSVYDISKEPGKALASIQKRLDLLETYSIDRKSYKKFVEKQKLYDLLIRAAQYRTQLAAKEEPGSEERAKLLEDAFANVETADGELKDRPATLEARADIYKIKGDLLKAIELRSMSAQIRGAAISVVNRIEMAKMYMQLKEIGAAKKIFAELCKGPEEIRRQLGPLVWVYYADCLRLSDEYQDALNAVEIAVRKQPDNPKILLLQADILEGLGRTDQAQTILARLEKAGGETGERAARDLFAREIQGLIKKEQFEEAIAKTREKYDEDRDDINIVRFYAVVLNECGRAREARQVLQEYLDKNPDSPVRGRIELALIEYDDSLSLEEKQGQIAALNRTDIERTEDQYEKAVRFAALYTRQETRNPEKAEENFKEAQRLILENATEAARNAGRQALQGLLSDRLTLALQEEINATKDKRDGDLKKMRALVDEITKEAMELDIDAAEGKTFVARVQMARGDYENAALTLKTVAEIQPENSTLLARLAQCYLALKDYEQARNTLAQVVDVDPRNGWAFKMLAVLSLESGQTENYTRYVKKAGRLLPRDPWVKEHLVRVDEQEDPEAGIGTREEHRKANPEDVDNLVRLAELYFKTSQYNKAEACYEESLRIAKDNSKYDYGLLTNLAANFFGKTGKPDKGLKILREYSDLQEDPAQKALAHVRIGHYLANAGDLPGADEAMLEAANIFPSVQVCVSLASYYSDSRRYAQGLKWINQALSEAQKEGSSDLASIKRMKIDYLLRNNNRDGARKTLDDYLAEYPEDTNGLIPAAQVYRAFGQIDKAIESLSRFIDIRPDANRVRFARAQLLAIQGEWAQVIQDLETIRSQDPTAMAFQPRILLSKAYRFTERPSLGITELKNVLDEYPEADAVALALINLYVDQEEYAQAERIVIPRLKGNPNNVTWLRTAGELAVLQGKEKQALGDLKKACVSSGYALEQSRLFLDACIKFKEKDAATRFFQQELPVDKRVPELMYRYAHILAMKGQTQDAVQMYLASIEKQERLSISFLSEVSFDIISAFGGLQNAIDLIGQEQTDKRLQYAHDVLYHTLIERSGDDKMALELNLKLVEDARTDQEKALFLVRLASLYSVQGDLQRAKETYLRSLEFEEQSFVALNNLAYLLTDDLNQPEQALPYAKKAVEINPNPMILDTLGWVYVKLNRYDDAIGVLTQALSQQPEYMDAMLHLAEAYRLSENFDAATRILETATKAAAEDEENVKAIEEIRKKVQSRDSSPV